MDKVSKDEERGVLIKEVIFHMAFDSRDELTSFAMKFAQEATKLHMNSATILGEATSLTHDDPLHQQVVAHIRLVGPMDEVDAMMEEAARMSDNAEEALADLEERKRAALEAWEAEKNRQAPDVLFASPWDALEAEAREEARKERKHDAYEAEEREKRERNSGLTM